LIAPLAALLAALARMLLLLTRLLLAATLLLAGLLTRVLVLLARFLVLLARVLILIAHSGSPLLNAARTNPAAEVWLPRERSSGAVLMWRRIVATAMPEPALETILYKPFG
jgi:hypothetical protein